MKNYVPLFENFENEDLFPIHKDIAKLVHAELIEIPEEEQPNLTKDGLRAMIAKHFQAEPGEENINKVKVHLKKMLGLN